MRRLLRAPVRRTVLISAAVVLVGALLLAVQPAATDVLGQTVPPLPRATPAAGEPAPAATNAPNRIAVTLPAAPAPAAAPAAAARAPAPVAPRAPAVGPSGRTPGAPLPVALPRSGTGLDADADVGSGLLMTVAAVFVGVTGLGMLARVRRGYAAGAASRIAAAHELRGSPPAGTGATTGNVTPSAR